MPGLHLPTMRLWRLFDYRYPNELETILIVGTIYDYSTVLNDRPVLTVKGQKSTWIRKCWHLVSFHLDTCFSQYCDVTPVLDT